MADSSEGSVAFKVKTSGDKTHSITMAESATVLDLKTKLAGEEFENIPVDRQRLIYSGRVMKNDDALSTYKIKAGNTVHMVKSAASNPSPVPTSNSAPVPQAVPQNMAAGTAANNLLAGLTGARFAGHANLPSRDLFGADGGMGAPPNEDQMADMLSNPAIAQTMNEALNNPAFVDYMIQSNPMLANMPNAREMLQSPYFRTMMTNPEALRMASRMRRMMGTGGAGGAFPAPGATDTTPAGAPSSEGAFFNPAIGQQLPNQIPGSLLANWGQPGADLRDLATHPATQSAQAPTTSTLPAVGQTGATTQSGSETAQRSTTGEMAQSGSSPLPQSNPFAALFGGGMPGAAGGPAGQNPMGLPPFTPEMMQQAMQLMNSGGMGGFGSPAAAAPADNRPPEERYAEQLRQLNDMGFFDFDRNVAALRRSGGSVQGAIEHLLSGS